MVELKNEVAGIVAIGGFVSLVLVLAGGAALVDAALGRGSPLVSAIGASLGVVGLVVVYAAVESGYFDGGTVVTTGAGSRSEAEETGDSGAEPVTADATSAVVDGEGDADVEERGG